MPLDGDDEMGVFCILLPQALDRSIKVRIYLPRSEARTDLAIQEFANMVSIRDQ